MSHSTAKLFGLLREQMQRPEVHIEALLALVWTAHAEDTEYYEDVWVPYMQGFPHHFARSLRQVTGPWPLRRVLARIPWARTRYFPLSYNALRVLDAQERRAICELHLVHTPNVIEFSPKVLDRTSPHYLPELRGLRVAQYGHDALPTIRALVEGPVHTRLTSFVLSCHGNALASPNAPVMFGSHTQWKSLRHLRLGSMTQLQSLFSSTSNCPDLHSLDLSGCNLDPRAVETLFQRTDDAHFSHLVYLDLRGSLVDDRDIAPLMNSPQMQSVRHLDLSQIDARTGGLDSIETMSSGSCPALQTLVLSHNAIDARTAEFIANSHALDGLKRLNIEHNEIGALGLRAIADSSMLSEMTELNVTMSTIGPDLDVSTLPHLARRLERLSIGWNSLSKATLEALFSVKDTTLRTLNLDCVLRRHGDDLLHSLSSSPLLAELQELSLESNHISDAALARFLSSEHTSNLRVLKLRKNEIGELTMRALSDSPYLSNLHTLHLYEHLTDEGARCLANARTLSNMLELGLSEHDVDESQAHILATSPNLHPAVSSVWAKTLDTAGRRINDAERSPSI